MHPAVSSFVGDDCPSEDELVEFVGGHGSPAELEAIERHLDRCPRCSETIALFGGAFARTSPARTPGDEHEINAHAESHEESVPPLPPDSSRYAGRYSIRECVGFGAGGLVYRALDLELERDVALKVLRNDDESPPADRSTRWRREAKIMAQVVHPNVVGVYDVGFFAGRMFIATEFVEGGTLRQWLDAHPRAWPEIVRAFVDAARGLEAIHQRGLVHRDFKPQNVMMGSDGRVRVTDFGLARRLPRDDAMFVETHASSDPLASTGPPDSQMSQTLTGALIGTPAYMSPEQWQGIPATPHSDQFSLCVALYEALLGERPWTARSAPALADAVCNTPPSHPKGKVPAWLARALMRGLSRRPEGRFEDMSTLIATLERAPRRRRRWALGLALGGGFAAVAAAGYGVARVDAPERCPAAIERFAEAWDEPTRTALTEHLDPALGLHVREVLDPWRETWLERHQHACRMVADKTLSERQYRLTTACLDRSLAGLRAITETLRTTEDADPDTVYQVLGVLRDPQACDDQAKLEVVRPAWSSLEAERLARTLAPELERVRVLTEAGRLDEALPLADSLVEQANAHGDPALRSEALVVLGHLLTESKNETRAVEVLKDAVWTAEASGHVEQAALGWVELIAALPVLSRYDEAEAAVDRAGAVVHRLDDPETRITFAANRAVLADRRGRFAEALEQHRQVLEQGLVVWGPDHPQIARVQTNIATALSNLGRSDEAIEHMELALALHERHYPGLHPVTVSMLSNLGVLEVRQENFSIARAHFERSRAMAEELVEPTDPMRLTILNNLAQIDYREGHVVEAQQRSERLLALTRQRYGDEHPDVAVLLHNGASMLAETGQVKQAELQFRETLELRRQLEGERHPRTALTMHGLGRLLVKLERFDEATELLSTALEIRQEINDDPKRRAATTYALAKSLAGQGRRAQARVMGQRALDLLDPQQPREATMRSDVEAWLETLD